MSLLPWEGKITPQLMSVIRGSPDKVRVLIKTSPSVMVSVESALVDRFNIQVVSRIPIAGYITAIVDREQIPEIAKMPQVIKVTHVPDVSLLQSPSGVPRTDVERIMLKYDVNYNVAVRGIAEGHYPLPYRGTRVRTAMPAMRDVGWLPAMKSKVGVKTDLSQVSDFLGLSPLKEQGITGKGVNIAIVDSGISQHPMLDGSIIKEVSFVGGAPRDALGHGTHVAGIAAGRRTDTPYGVLEGMAPDAKIVNVKVFEQSSTTADVCMQGLDFAAKNAKIVNCSWGAAEHFEPFDDLIRTLRSRYGTLFICAVGNAGPTVQTIVSPADSPDVVAVGSVMVPSGEASIFSSRGPAWDGSIKPDIMGCGEGITSSWPNGLYNILSGTSMATPTIAGALACLSQLGGINMNAIYGDASKAGVKDNTYGYGIPDFSKSVSTAISAGLPGGILANLGPFLLALGILKVAT